MHVAMAVTRTSGRQDMERGQSAWHGQDLRNGQRGKAVYGPLYLELV